MTSLISALYSNRIVRYIFFGGLTTLVNLISYYLLRSFTPLGITISNIISITLAIIFAFIVNSRYVFNSKASNFKEHLKEFITFFSARLSTMAIEVGSVLVLYELGMEDRLAKLASQFLVLILNYVFSKFIVFKK